MRMVIADLEVASTVHKLCTILRYKQNKENWRKHNTHLCTWSCRSKQEGLITHKWLKIKDNVFNYINLWWHEELMQHPGSNDRLILKVCLSMYLLKTSDNLKFKVQAFGLTILKRSLEAARNIAVSRMGCFLLMYGLCLSIITELRKSWFRMFSIAYNCYTKSY